MEKDEYYTLDGDRFEQDAICEECELEYISNEHPNIEYGKDTTEYICHECRLIKHENKLIQL